MKKAIIIFVGLMLGSLILCIVSIKSLVNDYNNLETKFTKELGKELIVDKDTLIIIDYSLINETFTLSDGISIKYRLVKTLTQ